MNTSLPKRISTPCIRELGGEIHEWKRVTIEEGFTFLDTYVLKLPWKLGELSLCKETSPKCAHKSDLVLGFSGLNTEALHSH